MVTRSTGQLAVDVKGFRGSLDIIYQCVKILILSIALTLQLTILSTQQVRCPRHQQDQDMVCRQRLLIVIETTTLDRNLMKQASVFIMVLTATILSFSETLLPHGKYQIKHPRDITPATLPSGHRPALSRHYQ